MHHFLEPKQRMIDQYTASVSTLELMFQETKLSDATGFFWEYGGKTYLVTNWHVVTGMNPLTSDNLNPNGGQPDIVKIDTYISQDLNRRSTASLALENEDGPLWLEHPVFGRSVDVVCIEMPKSMSCDVIPINKLEQQQLETRIADEVYILGYPLGINVARLPIWKRASIASEIDFDVDNHPKFLVDTASNKGMSGAPVVRRSSGTGLLEGGSTIAGGRMTRFVGVYSGRVSPKGDLDAQLGIVWKAHVIKEIIDGCVLGNKCVTPKPRDGRVVTNVTSAPASYNFLETIFSG